MVRDNKKCFQNFTFCSCTFPLDRPTLSKVVAAGTEKCLFTAEINWDFEVQSSMNSEIFYS